MWCRAIKKALDMYGRETLCHLSLSICLFTQKESVGKMKKTLSLYLQVYSPPTPYVIPTIMSFGSLHCPRNPIIIVIHC